MPPDRTLLDGWGAIEVFRRAGEALARKRVKELKSLRAHWDALLHGVGGEPSKVDWDTFRPLRVTREEDWSDWLGFLIGESQTGQFAGYLFDRSPGDCRSLDFDRERPVDRYRLDLLVRWEQGDMTHVEVKVGDLALKKTFDTALALESELRGSSITHFILLPRRHEPLWHQVESDYPVADRVRVRVLTWESIAIGLRRSLAAKEEELSWRTWARAFLGVVEQKLLGHPRWYAEEDAGELAETLDAIRILTESKT